MKGATAVRLAVKCSTPFGIGDGFAPIERPSICLRKSAQRLSASEMVSPFTNVSICASVACAQRLSASEMVSHERREQFEEQSKECSTPFGIGDGFAVADGGLIPGVQLCSTPFGIGDGFASGTCSSETNLSCAQRLSASEMVSHAYPVDGGGHQLVLNAFRHRRWFRVTGICASFVLEKCSTPFGIGDGFALRL